MRLAAWACLAIFLIVISPLPTAAQEDGEVVDLGTIQIMEKGERQIIQLEPEKDVINVDSLKAPSTPSNLADIVKRHPSIDFRGLTELMPEADSFFMRGFDGRRFSTSLNGLTLRQSGGRKSSHIVDYGALLPVWMIEDIEVIPGPHTALYPAKSVGGVINVIPRQPKRLETAKPEINLGLSYSSYETHNHHFDVHGGKDGAIYDAGVQKFVTDGYLRNSAADINTYYARGGYVFKDQGHLTLSALYVDADREVPIRNDPNDPNSSYDSDYPTVERNYSEFYDWQDPTWDKEAYSYDLHFQKPTSLGILSATASYREESRDRAYYNRRGGPIFDDSWETRWRHQGLRITDEFNAGESHAVTVGVEGTQLFDGYGETNWPNDYNDHERMTTWAAFGENSWDITSSLNLRIGLRYEEVRVQVNNFSAQTGANYITGRGDWIEREWGSLLPKSFLTWKLDGLADPLRDTSISLGVSRIWRAPDNHGEINPQGRPSGAWIDPEHGMGYDLTFKRRLWGDLQGKLNFSYYQIDDFIAHNSQFANYTPSGGNPVTPGQEYKDWVINLDRMDRKGAELQISGHIIEPLSFYLGYAYTRFENKGDEPAGKTVMEGRAEHQVNAGLIYSLFENTKLLIDYTYQDNEISEVGIETAPDVWVFSPAAVSAYNLVDVAVEQTLFTKSKHLEKGTLKLFVNNLFGENYDTVEGYPGLDRTFGAALTLKY